MGIGLVSMRCDNATALPWHPNARCACGLRLAFTRCGDARALLWHPKARCHCRHRDCHGCRPVLCAAD
eukprot:356500-Chlamydomonas_euryale.AAC.12